MSTNLFLLVVIVISFSLSLAFNHLIVMIINIAMIIYLAISDSSVLTETPVIALIIADVLIEIYLVVTKFKDKKRYINPNRWSGRLDT